MKLTFLGAAGEVTGSSFLLETDDVKVLVIRGEGEHFGSGGDLQEQAVSVCV